LNTPPTEEQCQDIVEELKSGTLVVCSNGACDQFYNITTGTTKLYCDNKGALSNAFKLIKAGITPYFNADHDLIEVAQTMFQLIPVLIATEWAKGHYSGNKREYKHNLNDSADCLAGD